MKRKVGRPRKTAKFIPSREAIRRISTLSKLSRYSEQQVFDDALEAGLVAIKDIYESIASFRSEQESEWRENDVKPEATQESIPEPKLNGDDPFALYDVGVNPGREAADLAQLGLDNERPGPVAALAEDPPSSGTSDPEPLLEHLPE